MQAIKRYIVWVCLVTAAPATAQTVNKSSMMIQPVSGQFFLDPYIANPAHAGREKGFRLSGFTRGLGTDGGIEGAPKTQAGTADFFVLPRVGAGINIYNDEAGLLKRTRVMGSYAYHLPVGKNDQQLHFGLSAGVNVVTLDRKALDGDPNDPLLNGFNRPSNHLEFDFGMAYSSNGLNIEVAAPSLTSQFRKKEDRNAGEQILYSAASWKLHPGGETFSTIEPKVIYRAIRGYDQLVDVGANIGMLSDKLNVFGLYHSTRNFTAGLGFRYWVIGVHMSYTSQISGLRNAMDGIMELGLQLSFPPKK